jgi:steroid delta-isomerase-like uncharacterized protein
LKTIEGLFDHGRGAALDDASELAFIGHDPIAGTINLTDEKTIAARFREAFPDLRCAIHETVQEGDLVACRWRMTGTHTGPYLGLGPTGERIGLEGITIIRFHGGRIAEQWTQYDALGLLRQLGVIPTVRELGRRQAQAREGWRDRV